MGILCGNGLKSKVLPSKSFSSFEHLMASIATNKAHITLVVIYRPPTSGKNKATITDFLAEFSTLLEEICVSPGHLIIAGDFNLHVNNTSSQPANKFLNLINSFNLTQHVNASTHCSGNTLDLVLTRSTDNIVQNLSVFKPCVSDHEAVLFDVMLNKPRSVVKTIKIHPLSKIGPSSFTKDLSESVLSFDPLADITALVSLYDSEL